jgi:hypothetical protein
MKARGWVGFVTGWNLELCKKYVQKSYGQRPIGSQNMDGRYWRNVS